MSSHTISRRMSLALALGGLFSATARAADGPPVWTALDAAAAKLIEDHGAPGVSISVLKGGRFAYSKGFGMADLETGTPATPASVFKIGSITKQFTAAALMSLVEAGKASADDTFARYYPDFPRAGEITLRQMLTHTSGLGNYTDTGKPEAFLQEARLDYDADALYRLMRDGTKPLYPYEPGTVWAYSNTAFVLLGLLVQKLAGEPYGAYYRRRLFDRAGLANTAVDDAADVVAHRAAGYTPHPGADRFDNASFISMTIPGGAGSMRSTSEDLCRWHEALFGGKVISPASLKMMTTPNRLKDGSLPRAVGAPADAKPVMYGFGIGTAMVGARALVGHSGGINGFSSTLQTFPDTGSSVSVLINCDGGEKLVSDSKLLREAAIKAAQA